MLWFKKYLFLIFCSLISALTLGTFFLMAEGGYDATGHVIGRDFLNTHFGGVLISEGRWEILFQSDQYHAGIRALHGADYPPHYWSYPPLLWPVSQFLALFPFHWAYVLWTAVGVAMVFCAARLLGLSWGWGVFICLSPAGAWNIFAGQNGFIIGSLMMIAVALTYKHKAAGAGLSWALLAVKPHLGLCVIPMLFGQRAFRIIGWGALLLAAMILATIALYGLDAWRLFFSVTSEQQMVVIETWRGAILWMVPSTFMQGRLWGLDLGMAYALQGAVALGAAVLLYRRWPGPNGALRHWVWWLVLGTLIILPYSFVYDMVILQFALALWFEQEDHLFRGRAQRWESLAFVGLWVLPWLSAWIALVLGLQIAPILLLFLLYQLPKSDDYATSVTEMR